MKKALKAVVLVIVLLLVLVAAILIIKTMAVSSKQMTVTPATPVPIDKVMAAEHLSQVVGFKTISYREPEKFDTDEFFAMQSYLQESFPQAHSIFEREVVAGLSLFYTWRGTDDSLKPILALWEPMTM